MLTTIPCRSSSFFTVNMKVNRQLKMFFLILPQLISVINLREMNTRIGERIVGGERSRLTTVFGMHHPIYNRDFESHNLLTAFGFNSTH